MQSPSNEPDALDRRSFLKRSSTATVIPFLAAPAAAAPASRMTDAAPQSATPVPARGLGEDYLVKGLTGLARACEKRGWFQAHWGAAVLAAHYLCQENGLDARLARAVKAQADALIEKQGFYFRPLENEKPDAKLVDKVARALEQPIAGLRSHGHAATFAALALRALRDLPDMATPTLIDGLCKISQRIGRNRPLHDHAYNKQNPLPPYRGEQSIANALFDCMLRYENVRYPPANSGGARRPNFTHQITYSDALIQLHRMGYVDLAKRGHEPHRIYVNTAPAKGLKKDRPMHPFARFDVVMSAEFWEYEPNVHNWTGDFDVDSNRMGDWLVGHVFKGLYSLSRLRRLVSDRNKVHRVERIVLERMVEPTIAGG